MNSALVLGLTYSIMLDVAAKTSKSLFTCKAGNFSVGKPGAITCYFGPSIHKKDYHIEINHYPFGASDSDSGDTVLQCYRPSGKLQCVTKAGFEFDNQIQANVTVTIPAVQTQFAGRYTCQLIPPDGREPEFCHLQVEESLPGEREGFICNSPEVPVLAVFVGILVVLCIVLVLFFIFRKSRRRRRLTRLFYHSRKNRSNTANETATKNHRDEDEEVRTPLIMPLIVPYPESEEEDQPDDNDEKTGFDGDEEDARQPYKINISLDYRVDYSDNAGESTGKRRFPGDEYDKGRSPVKITIQPYDENDDDGQVDQVGSPPPTWHRQRQPYRRAWSEKSSTPKVQLAIHTM